MCQPERAAPAMPRRADVVLDRHTATVQILTLWASQRRADPTLMTHPCLADDNAPLRGHAIVCGYGRVGQVIVAALQRCRLPLVVVEHDHRIVRRLRDQGTIALLGDAANPVLIEHMRLHDARVLVLAIPDALAARQVVDQAREVNPALAIVARTHSVAEGRELSRQGVGTVVMGEFELALGMTRYTLRQFAVADRDVEGAVQNLRGPDMLAPRDA